MSCTRTSIFHAGEMEQRDEGVVTLVQEHRLYQLTEILRHEI